MVNVDGKNVTCTTIGGLASAVGRSTRTVRYWIRIGLIPDAPLRLASDDPHLRLRLYPIELIDPIERGRS